MATYTIKGGTTFAEGTVVGAYPSTRQGPEGGPPSGTAASTATVTSGDLVFSGLADNTEYVAYAASPNRYKRFRTDPVTASTASGAVDGVDALGQYELLKQWGTGHSWDAFDSGTPATRWWQRMNSRLRTGVATHVGVGGKTAPQISYNTLAGTNKWIPASSGPALISWCCLVNDVAQFFASPQAQVTKQVERAVRSFLSFVTADALVAASTPQFAFSSGGWTRVVVNAAVDQTSTGGSRWETTTAGDYFVFTVVGDAVDVVLPIITTGGALVTFTIDGTGTVVGSSDMTGAVAAETPGIVKLRGLGANQTHTIRGTLTSGGKLIVDSYRIPSAIPCPVLLLLEPRLDWSDLMSQATGEALMTACKDTVKTVAAEYPTAVVVDMDIAGTGALTKGGWDYNTMRASGRHLNDKGMAYAASRCIEELNKLTFTAGLNTITTTVNRYPNPYFPPAYPTVPSGGQDGSAGTGGGTGTYTITDTFTRADTAATMGTTETGSKTWTVHLAGATWGISTNRAYASAGANSHAIVDTGAADGTVKAILSNSTGVTATMVGGLVFRETDENNAYRVLIRASGSDQHYTLFKLVAGVSTSLAVSTAIPAIGDEVLVDYRGSALKVYINGIQVISVTDSSFLTQTNAGFYGNFTAGPQIRWDNFGWGP